MEYAITNNRLEMTRKLPTKLALTTPTGEPFVNTSPVSIVKYSHGGHFIAVVTGRLVQLFHLYNLDYTTDKSGIIRLLFISTFIFNFIMRGIFYHVLASYLLHRRA